MEEVPRPPSVVDFITTATENVTIKKFVYSRLRSMNGESQWVFLELSLSQLHFFLVLFFSDAVRKLISFYSHVVLSFEDRDCLEQSKQAIFFLLSSLLRAVKIEEKTWTSFSGVYFLNLLLSVNKPICRELELTTTYFSNGEQWNKILQRIEKKNPVLNIQQITNRKNRISMAFKYD